MAGRYNAPVFGSDDWEAAIALRDRWRQDGLRVVLTNGCFDLLHSGHVAYLSEASRLGDRLIVGLNDDESVRRLKGAGRPICALADRFAVLSGLRAVDLVLAFSEDTASRLVSTLKPDVYVKGGDYVGANEPPEAPVARAAGSDVQFLRFVEGSSTRALIARILERFGVCP